MRIKYSECSVRGGDGYAVIDTGLIALDVQIDIVDGLPEARLSEATWELLQKHLSDTEISDLLWQCEETAR